MYKRKPIKPCPMCRNTKKRFTSHQGKQGTRIRMACAGCGEFWVEHAEGEDLIVVWQRVATDYEMNEANNSGYSKAEELEERLEAVEKALEERGKK